MRFYAGLFCVVFMSEQGQRFNRDVVAPDHAVLERLEKLLAEELRGVLE